MLSRKIHLLREKVNFTFKIKVTFGEVKLDNKNLLVEVIKELYIHTVIVAAEKIVN